MHNIKNQQQENDNNIMDRISPSDHQEGRRRRSKLSTENFVGDDKQESSGGKAFATKKLRTQNLDDLSCSRSKSSEKSKIKKWSELFSSSRMENFDHLSQSERGPSRRRKKPKERQRKSRSVSREKRPKKNDLETSLSDHKDNKSSSPNNFDCLSQSERGPRRRRIKSKERQRKTRSVSREKRPKKNDLESSASEYESGHYQSKSQEKNSSSRTKTRDQLPQSDHRLFTQPQRSRSLGFTDSSRELNLGHTNTLRSPRPLNIPKQLTPPRPSQRKGYIQPPGTHSIQTPGTPSTRRVHQASGRNHMIAELYDAYEREKFSTNPIHQANLHRHKNGEVHISKYGPPPPPPPSLPPIQSPLPRRTKQSFLPTITPPRPRHPLKVRSFSPGTRRSHLASSRNPMIAELYEKTVQDTSTHSMGNSTASYRDLKDQNIRIDPSNSQKKKVEEKKDLEGLFAWLEEKERSKKRISVNQQRRRSEQEGIDTTLQATKETKRQIKEMEDRLRELQQQSDRDMEQMKLIFESQKLVVEEEMRFAFFQEAGEQEKELEDCQKLQTMLEKEHRQLAVEQPTIESQIATMREENERPEKAHKQALEMYHKLNAWIKSKTKQNQKLESNMTKLKEINKGITHLKGETNVKPLYRRYLYKCVERTKSSDILLFLDVMEEVSGCETELGCSVLEFDDPLLSVQTKEVGEDYGMYEWGGDAHGQEDRIGTFATIGVEDDGKIDDDIDDFDQDINACSSELTSVMNKLDENEKTTLYENKDMLLAMFKLLDADGSGTIDREEFELGILLLNRRLPGTSRFKDDVRLFNALDEDGNGTIDLEEFQQLFNIATS